MNLSERQQKIMEIVRLDGPISGEQIALRLKVSRAALRSDLAILKMDGILDARPKFGYFYTGKSVLGLLVEEISRITVAEVQSVPVAVNIKASAREVVIKMFTEDVGSVYVVDASGLLSGVISRKDLLKTALNSKGDWGDLPVPMVMTPVSKIIFAESSDSVVSAACKLIDNEIDSLPVVKICDGDRPGYELVGRVTKTNFTRLLVELAEGRKIYHGN